MECFRLKHLLIVNDATSMSDDAIACNNAQVNGNSEFFFNRNKCHHIFTKRGYIIS